MGIEWISVAIIVLPIVGVLVYFYFVLRPTMRYRIDTLEHSLNLHCEELWKLERKISRLTQYLGVIEEETHEIKYVKKGGPEKGQEDAK